MPVLNTDSIRLSTAGDVISANVILDPDGNNAASVTASGLFISGPNETGWFPCDETVTYAGTDDPSFFVAVVGDKTAKYQPGMRFRCTQTTLKYFIITGVVYSGGTGLTTLTLYGGTDYDLVSGTITQPVYSTAKSPTGFVADPTKWTVRTADASDRSQANPDAATWYNVGGLTLLIPPGLWNVYLQANPRCVTTGGGLGLLCALSTAPDSVPDGELEARVIYGDVNMNDGRKEVVLEKTISLSIKTAYYPVLYMDKGTSAVGSLAFLGATDAPTIMQAACAYL